MIIDIDVFEFLRRRLQKHKRQDNRIKLFRWPLVELNNIWNDFKTWRSYIIYESHVTGQTMSLVDFLNRKVSGSANKISIVEKLDGGIFISKESENEPFVLASLESENTDFVAIPLFCETSSDIDTNFIVLAPETADIAQIDSIVKRYAIAGYSYTIDKF